MIIIYNIVIRVYSFLVWIASFFNPKAKKFISGRKNWKQNLTKALENNKKPVIWFHCASLGEFEQARPVIEGIEGDNFILLSFFSPSGYEVRKNYAKADYVCYLPLDTASNVSFFINAIHPKLAVFVKYEFWYHFLSALQNKKIPHILISAVFRENQYLFDSKATFLLEKVKNYSRIFVQDENSFQILQKTGFLNAELAGDTRFDRVLQTKNSIINLPKIQEFKNNEPLLVCGSIWKEDFEVLLPFLNSSSVKTIIAPHEIHQEEINKWKNALKRKVSLYSDNNSDCEILIIDNIGLLSSIYSYANFAYVGGAFGKGLHNVLEPAVFGIPVVFGPKIRRFPEAIALINNGGCFSIQDEKECKALFENLVNNENKEIGVPNAEFIEKHKGASTKILTHIQKLLN